MSKSDPVGTNSNDQMPVGGGLKPGEVVPEEFEDEELYGDDRPMMRPSWVRPYTIYRGLCKVMPFAPKRRL